MTAFVAVEDQQGLRWLHVLLSVVFSQITAFLFAASDSLQQRSAQLQRGTGINAPPDGTGRTAIAAALWRLFGRLIHQPLWLAGWLINLVGFFTQAAALHFGSIGLVQPLLVTQLLFALPLGSAWHHAWPALRDWLSAASVMVGIVVFLSVPGVAPRFEHVNRDLLILACVAAAAGVVLLTLIAARLSGALRATMLAVAAGICYAITAAMIKLTVSDLLDRGVAATARDWPGYVLAVATLVSLVLEQGAFATGSLAFAVAGMAITNPIVSYLIAILALGAPPPDTIGSITALAGAGVLMSVGALGLAHARVSVHRLHVASHHPAAITQT